MNANKIKVFAVGDIFLGEHPYTMNHGVTTKSKENGCEYLFNEIKEYLVDGDIVCGNLEGIISPKQDLAVTVKSSIFWGESSCAAALKKAGITCIFLANNHTAQHGKKALLDTCRLLDKNKIKWVGVIDVKSKISQPIIIEKNGINVGLLAYCETQQYHLESRILPIIELKQIEYDINKLKKTCDIVIVSLHWGDEFIDTPSPEQIILGRKIIDAGANVILGHHSHAMQGIEHYKHGLIVYSLGSFIKDLWRQKLRESIILSLDITKDGKISINYIPIKINSHYQPVVYRGRKAEKFLDRLELLEDKIIKVDLNEIIKEQRRYRRKVILLERLDKLDTLKHYLTNIYKYDKKLFIENILLILKRRLKGKNI